MHSQRNALDEALVLTLLTVALATLLLLGDRLFAGQGDSAVDRIERVLPRIQCGQCGYAGCRPYAQALVDGTAAINLCPPGGIATVRQLAELLGEEPLPIPLIRCTGRGGKLPPLGGQKTNPTSYSRGGTRAQGPAFRFSDNKSVVDRPSLF